MTKLILLRHAHRDTTQGRELDNGLSEKGQAQSKLILKKLFKKLNKRPVRLFTSPAQRCRETIEPLSQKLQSKPRVLESLYEQHESESVTIFRERIHSTLEELKSDKQDLLLCSHGDWLPIALELLVGQTFSFKKGRWAFLHYKNGELVRFSIQCQLS